MGHLSRECRADRLDRSRLQGTGGAGLHPGRWPVDTRTIARRAANAAGCRRCRGCGRKIPASVRRESNSATCGIRRLLARRKAGCSPPTDSVNLNSADLAADQCNLRQILLAGEHTISTKLNRQAIAWCAPRRLPRRTFPWKLVRFSKASRKCTERTPVFEIQNPLAVGRIAEKRGHEPRPANGARDSVARGVGRIAGLNRNVRLVETKLNPEELPAPLATESGSPEDTCRHLSRTPPPRSYRCGRAAWKSQFGVSEEYASLPRRRRMGQSDAGVFGRALSKDRREADWHFNRRYVSPETATGNWRRLFRSPLRPKTAKKMRSSQESANWDEHCSTQVNSGLSA